MPNNDRPTLNKILSRFGLSVPKKLNDNVVFPDSGWFAKHPKITRTMENALLAAAGTQGGETVGQSISNVAQGVLGVPQMREQIQTQREMVPFQKAATFLGLEGMQAKIDDTASLGALREAQGLEAGARSQYLEAQAEQLGKPRIKRVIPGQKGFFSVYESGKTETGLYPEDFIPEARTSGRIGFEPDLEEKYRGSDLSPSEIFAAKNRERRQHYGMMTQFRDLGRQRAGKGYTPEPISKEQLKVLRDEFDAKFPSSITSKTLGAYNAVKRNYGFESRQEYLEFRQIAYNYYLEYERLLLEGEFTTKEVKWSDYLEFKLKEAAGRGAPETIRSREQTLDEALKDFF